jgi:hypothetical protein
MPTACRADNHWEKAKMSEKEIENMSRKFYAAINTQISDALEENQIMTLPTTKEELHKRHFICPLCRKRKTADHMEIVKKPLKIEQKQKGKSIEVTVSMEQLICCDSCSQKYFPVSEGATYVE